MLVWIDRFMEKFIDYLSAKDEAWQNDPREKSWQSFHKSLSDAPDAQSAIHNIINLLNSNWYKGLAPEQKTAFVNHLKAAVNKATQVFAKSLGQI